MTDETEKRCVLCEVDESDADEGIDMHNIEGVAEHAAICEVCFLDCAGFKDQKQWMIILDDDAIDREDGIAAATAFRQELAERGYDLDSVETNAPLRNAEVQEEPDDE